MQPAEGEEQPADAGEGVDAAEAAKDAEPAGDADAADEKEADPGTPVADEPRDVTEAPPVQEQPAEQPAGAYGAMWRVVSM